MQTFRLLINGGSSSLEFLVVCAEGGSRRCAGRPSGGLRMDVKALLTRLWRVSRGTLRGDRRMIVLAVGNTSPVAPVAPVTPVIGRKAKAAEKSSGRGAATQAARPADAMASYNARAALDDLKLGG